MTTLERSDIQPDDLTVKSLPGGQVSVDDAQGIVEFFASGIGNKDGVGDIVMPGAFSNSLKRRKPRVVWGHDWNHPIGKVLEIFEVGPGDPRLPIKMKAAGIGGLFVKAQFNLKSERGREAFANVVFFGDEQEYSIGYKTLDSEFSTEKRANLLKELELFEVSPVLHGANSLTGTIAFKSADSEDVSDEQIKRGLSMLKVFSDENEDWVPEIPEGVKRQFTEETRRNMADRGQAMDDGSYPIANESDLRNAIQAVGRAKDIDAAKRHIKKRARALGLTDVLPDDWKSIEVDVEEKVSLTDIPGAEGNTSRGEVLGGRGPRRGNLEDLLNYWRPIMKRPGGFRRCLVILADHPELYPLPNICAWLHHETTGKWPNEGHHHGGAVHAARALAPGKSEEHADMLQKQLERFIGEAVEVTDLSESLVTFKQGDETFESLYHEVEGDFLFGHKRVPKTAVEEDGGHPCEEGEPCVCGGKCNLEKSLDVKSGRVVSSRNLAKLQQAVALLAEVVSSAVPVSSDDQEEVVVGGSQDVKTALEVVSGHHGGSVQEKNGLFVIEVKSPAHLKAIQNVVKSLDGAFVPLESGVNE